MNYLKIVSGKKNPLIIKNHSIPQNKDFMIGPD